MFAKVSEVLILAGVKVKKVWQKVSSSPRWMLIITAGLLFILAAARTVILYFVPDSLQDQTQLATGLVFIPAVATLYFFLYRPLVKQIAVSHQIQSELQTTKENLEARVLERTLDLSEANRQLSNELAEHKHTAAALRQAEEKYRGIFENAAEGVYQTTLDGHFLAANPALARILGYDSPAEMMSAVADVGHQVYADPNRRLELARILERDGEIKDFEFQAYRRDGTIRWLIANSRLVRDEAGNPSYYEGVMTDVTERKDAEAELRKLSLAVEQSPASLVITDLKGNIEYVNPRFIQLTGYSHDEVLGKNLRILKSGETSSEEYKRLWKTIMAGREWCGVFHNRKKNGELYWESASISPILDDQGNIKNFLSVSEDITARQQAEEELAQERDLLRTLIDSMPDFIFIKDTQSRFVVNNIAHIHLLKASSQDEIVGKTDSDIFPQEFAARYFADEQQVIRSGLPLMNREELVVDPAGNEGWLLTTKVPFRDRTGTVIGLVGISRDITARRKSAEELREALERTRMLMASKEQRNNEMKLLSEMGDFLQSCRSAPEAYAAVAEYAGKLFPNLSGALGITCASRNLVEFVGNWGNTALHEKIFTPDDCWALRRGRNYSVSGSNPELYCKHTSLPFPAASLCVPMMAQGEALGILYLRSEETISDCAPQSEILTSTQIRLAMAMAEQIALALANLNLREALRSQAIRDALTGMFNRRYMEETLERELRRAERHGEALGVIMLDIDHFKKFNDTFGHAAGDAVLHELGEFLLSRTRGEDFVCRYGGEEIAIIMLDITPEDAALRAEQLRQGIRQLQLSFHNESLGAISVSLGVAGYPQHGANGNALLRAADSALYRAKRAGRDRVVVASTLEEPIPSSMEPSKVS